MIDQYLVDSCQKAEILVNEYGDTVYTTKNVSYSCRFRYISNVRRSSNEEVNETDAMLWLSPTAPFVRGDYLFYSNVFYKIERITRALRLGETNVQFLKCDLKEVSIGIS